MRGWRDVESPGKELLDHQLVDAGGMLCGNVDDIELELREGGAVVRALLSGPGNWPHRLPRPLRGVARRLLKPDVVRIEPGDVERIDAAVRLKRHARDLGLGRGEDRPGRWLARLPGGEGQG